MWLYTQNLRTCFRKLPRWGRVWAFSIRTFALASLITACGQAEGAPEPRPRADSFAYAGVPLGEWKRRLVDFDSKSSSATQAVEPLMAILADRRVDDVTRRNAAIALGNIGEPARGAVPQLRQMIIAKDERGAKEAQWAGKALSLMGPAARDAAPALARVVRDDECPLALRQLALEALARIAGAHPDAVPAIVEVIGVNRGQSQGIDSRQLRELAVEAVGVAGPDAAVATPLLIRILRDPRESESIRRQSVISIGKMSDQASIAAGPLAEALVLDESEAVRDEAANALASIGPRGQHLIVRLLGHEDAGVRWRAASALGRAKRPSHEIIAALEAALADDAEMVQLRAVESLVNLDVQASITIPAIVRLLNSEERMTRTDALDLLVLLGDDAQTALPQLKRMLRSDRADVRRIAQTAIRRIAAVP